MDRPYGFGLPEIVIALALCACLATWAVPSYQRWQLESAQRSAVEQLVRAIHLARGEAMKRNAVVSLCPSRNGHWCAPTGSAWQDGWIAFLNLDRDNPAVRDVGEPLLQAYASWPGGSVESNRDTLSLRAFAQNAVTATLTFCDARGATAARAVIVSQTGRPRVSNRTSGGAQLNCPR
ncbi:MAG TPA: GspH/FimT family pseudopilin [Steroidobacteraceae bacterium]|nr:GspH/FimT family pseudopilin [Steroidobacteraceae bacterium]